MKITNRHANTKYFKDLKKGDVFKLLMGEYVFMKTERIETENFECNAVNLTNGDFIDAYETTIVIPLESELIVG